MILSSCKNYLHPCGKEESSHAIYVIDLILGIYFLRIAPLKKTMGLASAKFLFKGC